MDSECQGHYAAYLAHWISQPVHPDTLALMGSDRMYSVWDEIEQTLVDLYSLPHNRIQLQSKNLTPQTEAKRKVDEVKSGLASVTREDYSGPRLFLRVTGPANRAYSGEWWFDARLLDTLHTAYSRIYFTTPDKKRALRDMLRELLAISSEWNRITEVWVLSFRLVRSLGVIQDRGILKSSSQICH